MAKPTARIGLIQVMLALGFVVVVGRAAQLQIIQGGTWRARADSVRREKVVLPARRGGIHFVESLDELPRFDSVLAPVEDIEVVRRDDALLDQRIEIHHAFPELTAEQEHR